tara:strand:- start:565 stop:723 length:159 start_codon:yes stop_codon:yes gene_type:complete
MLTHFVKRLMFFTKIVIYNEKAIIINSLFVYKKVKRHTAPLFIYMGLKISQT